MLYCLGNNDKSVHVFDSDTATVGLAVVLMDSATNHESKPEKQAATGTNCSNA